MRRSPTSLIPGLLRLAACLLLALPAAGFAADDVSAPAPALTAKQQAAADKAAAKAAAKAAKAEAQSNEAAAQQAKDADKAAQKAAKREAKLLQLFIAQPYLELHTGPGRGYPVTQVVGRGEAIDVLAKKTEWFKVRTERGIEGWANEKDLVLAHEADGTLFVFSRGNRESFTNHNWETGIFAGAYAGASTISAYESYSFNDQLKIEITLGQYLGNISNGYIAEIGLNHVFMPQWRLSPFITLGTGYDRVVPKVTLAQPLDSTNQTAYIGAGARFYMTRRFFLRADYRYHTVFTSRDQNEVKQEWKLGFAFFY